MFRDRREAGRRLGSALGHLAPRRPVVLALPRGGVIVGAEVALALDAPLDVLVVRKIGAPLQPELALGAVMDGNPPQRVLNEDLVRALRIERDWLDAETARQVEEARRRLGLYLGDRTPVEVEGRTVIVVDDGVATGATVTAALDALRARGVEHLVLAVPVGPPETLRALRSRVDELICLECPGDFRAVGSSYETFAQTTDEEVVAAIEAAAERAEA